MHNESSYNLMGEFWFLRLEIIEILAKYTTKFESRHRKAEKRNKSNQKRIFNWGDETFDWKVARNNTT